jgi:hypothetical protein
LDGHLSVDRPGWLEQEKRIREREDKRNTNKETHRLGDKVNITGLREQNQVKKFQGAVAGDRSDITQANALEFREERGERKGKKPNLKRA